MGKTRLTEESAKNLREWFDVEVENIKEYAKLPGVVDYYCFGYEAAMKKAKQKLIRHRVI